VDTGTIGLPGPDTGIGPGLDSALPPEAPWRFVVLADSHVIDEWYVGPENSPLDTESILFANERYALARDAVRALRHQPDFVAHVGDYIHTYPSDDLEFYFDPANRTSLTIAQEISTSFGVPFHLCLGNHDYKFSRVSRDFTHELFRRTMGLQPYYAVNHRGFKFVFLNNFIGVSHAYGTADYNTRAGTFGREQLEWLEAELQQGVPTFLFVHFPMPLIPPNEFGSLSLLSLMQDYAGTIAHVISGHWHRWFDFEDTFGPRCLAMGSTRYDEDAMIVVEVDPQTMDYRFLNMETWTPGSHVTAPWTET
jgi:predicted phosphodiesterase